PAVISATRRGRLSERTLDERWQARCRLPHHAPLPARRGARGVPHLRRSGRQCAQSRHARISHRRGPRVVYVQPDPAPKSVTVVPAPTVVPPAPAAVTVVPAPSTVVI